MSEAQVYIGTDKYPLDNQGDPSVAPGDYPYKAENLGNATFFEFDPISVTGDFWIIVHTTNCIPDDLRESKVTTQQTLKVTPYPTVFEEEITLDIEVNSETRAKVGVYGMNGAQLKAEQVQLNSGRNQVRMNLSNLSGAMYILEVQTLDGQRVLNKIMSRR
jgi:hypothetical protein